MSPRKPASEELTREMIIKEAQIQFAETDFNKVSMRNIAKKLGCSHGAIYYHFKNKAEVFYAIIEMDFAHLNKLVLDIVNGKEENSIKLKKIFLSFMEFGLNHQSDYEIMFLSRNTEVDALSQNVAYESYQQFAQSVHLLSEKKLAIASVWSAFISLHGFVSYYRGYVQNFEEAKEAAEAHVQFVLTGLYG